MAADGFFVAALEFVGVDAVFYEMSLVSGPIPTEMYITAKTLRPKVIQAKPE